MLSLLMDGELLEERVCVIAVIVCTGAIADLIITGLACDETGMAWHTTGTLFAETDMGCDDANWTCSSLVTDEVCSSTEHVIEIPCSAFGLVLTVTDEACHFIGGTCAIRSGSCFAVVMLNALSGCRVFSLTGITLDKACVITGVRCPTSHVLGWAGTTTGKPSSITAEEYLI